MTADRVRTVDAFGWRSFRAFKLFGSMYVFLLKFAFMIKCRAPILLCRSFRRIHSICFMALFARLQVFTVFGRCFVKVDRIESF